MGSQFDVQFTILRDGEEIGFGGAVASSLDAAAHDVESTIVNRIWETAPGMPDPDTIDTGRDDRGGAGRA